MRPKDAPYTMGFSMPSAPQNAFTSPAHCAKFQVTGSLPLLRPLPR